MEKNDIFTTKVFVRYILQLVSCTNKFSKLDNAVIPTSVELIANDRSECHLAIPGGVPAIFNWLGVQGLGEEIFQEVKS